MKHFYQDFAYLTKKNIDKFERLIKAHQDFVTLWLPGIGSRRNAYELSNGFIGRHLKVPKIKFISLDLSLKEKFVEKQLVEGLSAITKKDMVRNMIKRIVDDGNTLYFILNKINKESLDMMKYLWSLRDIKYDNVRYIMFFEENEYNEILTLSNDTILTHNIIYIECLTLDESAQWLKINEKRYSLSLSDEIIENIYKFSGGIPGIMRSCLRGLVKYRTLKEVFNSVEVQNLEAETFNRYNEREQQVLRQIILTGTPPPYIAEVKYLKRHNLIQEDNTIVGEWLIDYVKRDGEDIVIKFKENKVVWEDVVVNDLFSENELLVLIKLLNNPDEYLTKDDIAKIIWKDDASEKYSEWALDQIISRLRKKLDKIGIGGRILKTTRGKGYKLQYIKIIN